MAMTMEDKKVCFDAVVYEDEVSPLRSYLQESAPEQVMFDFSACSDVHMAVLQVVLSVVPSAFPAIFLPLIFWRGINGS